MRERQRLCREPDAVGRDGDDFRDAVLSRTFPAIRYLGLFVG
jgi:hypothetical protein